MSHCTVSAVSSPRGALLSVLVGLGLLTALAGCSGEDTPAEPVIDDSGDPDGGEGGGAGEEGGESGGEEGGGEEGGSTGDDELTNLLLNGGFEAGESWSRPSGVVNADWAQTGHGIYNSSDAFEALEGERALKVWGFYGGSVPNSSEHGLELTQLTPGDAQVFSAMAFTHADDAVSGGNEVELFLRYFDNSGNNLGEYTSEAVDEDSAKSAWQELRVEATVPDRAFRGALGVRYTLASWDASGSVYLDDASWTSTGTGAVTGERLLVWKDEFDGSGLDESSWTRQELSAYTYNNEQQRYTDSTANADVSGGQLVITARQESDGSITSARLITDAKAEWRYARIEAMLQVPDGVGTWPAFWMLPSDWSYGDWPYSGEIDIMEHVGCDLDSLYATVHTGAYNHTMGTQKSGDTTRDASASMHLYAVDWYEDEMVFTVDGEPIFTFENDGAGDSDTWPFDQTFHIILNLAFGGDWGGYCGVDKGSLPQEYRVDWVRVYQ